MSELQEQAIRQHCKALRMPTIGSQFARLAEAAVREGQSHIGYLEALLAAEMEERESRAIARLLHEARLPRMKTLDEFEFDRSGVSAAQLRELAEGGYIGQGRAGAAGRRGGHGQDAPGHGPVRGRLPPAAPGAVRDRDRADQRTRRGGARQPAQPRARPLGAARPDLHRRAGLRAARRDRVRADVPGDRRPGREGGGDRDHQPAVLRMVAGHPQPAAVQGADRPPHRPGAHHHHRHRLLPVPPHRKQYGHVAAVYSFDVLFDLGDQIIKKRLDATKVIEFVKTGDQKLEHALADQAWLLAAKGAANIRCLVYCDSRETAEETKKAIEKLSDGDKKTGIAKIKVGTELFVGARRAKEREAANQWLADHGFLAGSDTPCYPVFLIATSAGEVGVDLDADHIVCDIVPWERMIQRLGRVNRRGEGSARVVIVDKGQAKPNRPDQPTPKEMRESIAYRALAIVKELPKNWCWLRWQLGRIAGTEAAG